MYQKFSKKKNLLITINLADPFGITVKKVYYLSLPMNLFYSLTTLCFLFGLSNCQRASFQPEVIDQLVADGRLNAPEGIAHSLKSLTSVKGQFSECGIRGPDGWLFGRLLLDKYSLAIFSTTGHMVQKLNDLVNVRGMNMGDALEQLVESGEVI